MVKNIKVIIGASYGDEGKGLMTDYFCHEFNAPNITVLHNGGSQRGHTVLTPDNVRHVFHHFSSGTFAGSDTFFADSFIINPLVFAEEFNEIQPRTKIFYSDMCRISTPFDMIINQIIEEKRGAGRHGSCGYGIWETIVRCNSGKSLCPSFFRVDSATKYTVLKNIRDEYVPFRLNQLGIEKIPPEWEDIIYDEGLITHFIDDCDFFSRSCIKSNPLDSYSSITFEGGQGLLLNQSETNVNTTPSFTGAENPVRIIKKLNDIKNIEVCYVTRSYLTRHGAGGFPHECRKSEINPDIVDRTNVHNDWQGSIRYGRIDVAELKKRVADDFSKFSGLNAEMSVAVTHLNETGGKLITTSGNIPPENLGFEKIYKSYSEKRM